MSIVKTVAISWFRPREGITLRPEASSARDTRNLCPMPGARYVMASHRFLTCIYNFHNPLCQSIFTED